MAAITPLASGRGLPDLAVAEFAIMVALMRLGPSPAPVLLPLLSDWFGHAVGLDDIEPFLRRLMRLGFVVKEADSTLQPQRRSAQSVSACFAALIRLVGSQFEHALEQADPQLLDQILKEASRSNGGEDQDKDKD